MRVITHIVNSLSMKMRRLLLLIGFGLLLAGCAPSYGLDSRTGVSALPDGRVQLHYALCPGERMHLVRVEELVGARPDFGVPIYWQIESLHGSSLTTYTVGETPPGFVETVALTRALPAGELLGIEGTGDGLGMSFDRSRLTPDRVLRGSYDEVSLQTFTDDAARKCRQTRTLTLIGAALIPAALYFVTRLFRARRTERYWLHARVAIMAYGFAVATYIAHVIESVRHYEFSAGGAVFGFVFALIFGLFLAVFLAPVMEIVRFIGRRLNARHAAVFAVAISVATTAVLWRLFHAMYFGTYGSTWAVAIGVGIGAGVEPPYEDSLARQKLWSRRGCLLLVISVACGMISVGMLSNWSPSLSPASATTKGVTAQPPEIALPDAATVIHEQRGAGPTTRLIPIVVPSSYIVQVACTGVSVQLSEAYIRRVLPCDGTPIPGAFNNVPDGDQIDLLIDPAGSTRWHLIVSAP